ncbi:SusC/RagA family TonB-linked outer membrane protein [Mucilaginibacter sp. KACC 22773]|uniref:SusC/RagA family TonB-linked outer membrane protein n=1 Tax=Mucilaginibacter sp. KACC 22773 TaxID=3025671 RepID=UPI0023656FE3|nr:SusC/RagA family TonB-linked outer membrane protein [Mucilaginibacter sp. KACC 22773]WDF77075.1 SusC/RagA family TonB-linked outer membrane protein [Mucilaginibacter sp. KACC 22773]
MKKTILIIVLAALCLNSIALAQKTVHITGRVIDSADNKPLPRATIEIKSNQASTTTDEKGNFEIYTGTKQGTLIISFIGYKTIQVSFNENTSWPINIFLPSNQNELKEVNIVSTGYQTLPKERATGAFTFIDKKTINRSVEVNILDRLEGVASGLLLNRGLDRGANNPTISIRGRSTLFANAEPLVVYDGFPYEGAIDQINPADIESISILKDAAAASIWGTRASNGVIVLTSKKGNKNKKMEIGLTSTLTISSKPNLNYIPQMSSSEYIDLEQYLFGQGYYDQSISQIYAPISMAVEIMNKRRDGEISVQDSASQINKMKGYDVRSDLNKYVYRPKIYQQYQLNLSGGGENNSYYISGGYDKNLENTVTNNYNRLTFDVNNNVSLFKGKLTLTSGVYVASTNTNSKYGTYTPYSPYDRLADEAGKSLPVVSNLRIAYIDTAGNGKLLDWHYRPKDELVPNQHNNVTQYKLKFGINYDIGSGLNASVSYQYLNQDGNNRGNYGLDNYYVRDLINTYSSIFGNTVSYGVPIGNVFNKSLTNLKSKIFRTQLTYSKLLSGDHEINAIVGYETNDGRTNSNNQLLYGYQPETLINGNNLINPLVPYSIYYDPNQSQLLSTAPILNNLINFTQSYYANISYGYKGKYILSGSARRDESNLFGVKTNQKGVPLWSAGLAWNIDREKFYHIDWLKTLKLRATFGYNGNVDKTLAAFLTSQSYGFTNRFGNVYSTISNPPNPSLTWETVKTWNLGLDFTTQNNRVSGSLDIYKKDAQDLIGNSPISMISGLTAFKGNNANLSTNGIDIEINTKNLTNEFRWSTTYLFNYNTDKVTNYKAKQSSNYEIVSGNYNNPLEGYPYYGVFSFPSAGLDATGAPQGYVNGAVSKDYSTILYSLTPASLKYHGSGSPKYFGSVINTFGYKEFELSLNITYKLGYFFRRQNVFSGGSYLYQQADYDKRWKKPGDELITKGPSLVYPQDDLRSTFFTYSEDNVEKGDHIRLQDIKLNYQVLSNILQRSPFKKASIFIYARNLGILWRANKLNIDPDYGTTVIPQPFSCSLGINLNL